jgi:hypothetical protein
MILIVSNEHCFMLERKAGDLQVKVADDPDCLFELRLELPKAPVGVFVIGEDNQSRLQHIQSRPAISGYSIQASSAKLSHNT